MDSTQHDQKLACSALFGSHSNDRVKVWYGALQPANMCKRHAHRLTPGDYTIMRAKGTIK